MYPMLTPQKLKAIRNICGVTQSQLAEQSGMSAASIANFESGKSDMRASTIAKLCKALGVKVIYIIGDTEITGP